ncbi:hypothetical protein ACFVY9_22280 [Streptomyces sp. NPDC059544]|uniref:hypothetical protein n=1 Tax=Streptomyces sp. NPDC059544 TaxID=3346861 RepID=UPI0036C3627F
MKKHTKRIAVTACSVVAAGVAALGAGGTASAATPASAYVQRQAVGVNADDYRWDHGVGYLLEQGYSWDENRGWHKDGPFTDSARHGRDGYFCRWDGEERGWTYDRSYRHDGNRYEHDSRDRHHNDGNHGDR